GRRGRLFRSADRRSPSWHLGSPARDSPFLRRAGYSWHHGDDRGNSLNALAISDGLFRRLQARGIHYAWAVLVVTFLYSLAASTAMTVPSVLVVPIANEFGWGLGDVSSAMALRLFLFGAMAPFAGAFLVKYGLRRMMLVSGSLSVIGLILAITMTSKFQLWLSLGVVLGVAPGLTALVVT